MYYNNQIYIGNSDGEKVCILPKMANRHGLITGATGTGKTVTLKVLAESFSDAGVPVFISDIKGDLSGMCRPGTDSADMQERIRKFGLDECGFGYKAYPTAFWDVYGKSGIPVRTTVSEMGPVLLARLMELTPAQTDVLNIAFKIADNNNLLLIDTKDLKSMLQYIGDNSADFAMEYGNIPRQSVTTIIRHIVSLESMGAEQFFTEPALNITDWFTQSSSGQGMINVLDCRQLVNNPTMYSVFLLWMMSTLFDALPEVGDMDKPRMVFFFDEAHLLFGNISRKLQEKVEQIVKLIRSRGVGIYFISQSPKDIPDGILSQLGNKIQHALRAYTPADEKALKSVAASFRANPAFDTKTAISELGTGEALISVLDEGGIPTMVRKCKILPPQSMLGPISDDDRQKEILMNNLYLKYKDATDPESAYEVLQKKNAEDAAEAERLRQEELARKEAEKQALAAEKAAAKEQERLIRQSEREAAKRQRAVQSGVKRVANSAAGTIGREIGNNLGKSLGGSFGKKLGGNLGASIGRSIMGTFFR